MNISPVLLDTVEVVNYTQYLVVVGPRYAEEE